MDVNTVESWGYIQPDGTINGMVHMLDTRQIDFGGSPLFCKYERLPIIDYAVSTWILRSAFIFRRPKVSAPPMEVFVRPLSGMVWFCVATTTAVVVFLLRYVMTREMSRIKRGLQFNPKKGIGLFRRNNKKMPFKDLPTVEMGSSSWSYSFLVSISVLCQQGSFHTPLTASGKMLVYTFLAFTTILYQFYSGYILSYILMDPPRVINNLHDLLKSPDLAARCDDVLFDKDYFSLTTDPVAKEIYRTKLGNGSGFLPPNIGLELVHKGGYAFHVETSAAYPIITKSFSAIAVCELDEVQMYRIQIMYTNLQKRSPFKQIFDHCMRRMHEQGSIRRMRTHWDARKPQCMKQGDDQMISVGLQEFSFALILLLIGVVSSGCILVIELLHWKISGSMVYQRKQGTIWLP